jgi:hypothetical protein
MKTLSLSDYTITENGEIINNKNGKKLKPQPNGKGYLRVSIGGKLQFIHRLVAEKYIPNPENKPQVNHKDGNKLNNSVDNLEWVSNMENRQHAVKNLLHLSGEKCPWSKITQKDVDFIRENKQYTARQIAEMFNISITNVRTIRQGRSWKSS